MKRSGIIVVFLIIPALAGCLTPGEGETADDAEKGGLGALDETLPDVPVSFRALTRAGGMVEVEGVAWEASGATTAVLLIHGSGGGMRSL